MKSSLRDISSRDLLRVKGLNLKGSALGVHTLCRFLFFFSRRLRYLSKDWLALSQYLAPTTNAQQQRLLNERINTSKKGFLKWEVNHSNNNILKSEKRPFTRISRWKKKMKVQMWSRKSNATRIWIFILVRKLEI